MILEPATSQLSWAHRPCDIGVQFGFGLGGSGGTRVMWLPNRLLGCSSEDLQKLSHSCNTWAGISQHPKGQGERWGLALVWCAAGVCLAQTQVRCLCRAAQLTEVARSSPRHRCSSPPSCMGNWLYWESHVDTGCGNNPPLSVAPLAKIFLGTVVTDKNMSYDLCQDSGKFAIAT